MDTTGNTQNRGQVTIPAVARRPTGLSIGNRRGKIVIALKLIDRSAAAE